MRTARDNPAPTADLAARFDKLRQQVLADVTEMGRLAQEMVTRARRETDVMTLRSGQAALRAIGAFQQLLARAPTFSAAMVKDGRRRDEDARQVEVQRAAQELWERRQQLRREAAEAADAAMLEELDEVEMLDAEELKRRNAASEDEETDA